MTMIKSIKTIKTIKPSFTQTSHPQTLKLSALDKMCPDIHANVTFFYPNNNGDFDHSSHFFHISQQLQDSLSETLNLFYPIAGRYLDDCTIACNDEGVTFFESETDYRLSDILASPDHRTIEEQFLPSSYPEVKETSNGRPLLLINFILFRCGGTGVSISFSHKIFDLASLMIFLNSWTAIRAGSEEPIVPELNIASSLLAPRELSNNPNKKDPPPAVDIPVKKYTMRRFVFRPSKVTELKNKLSGVLKTKGHENYHPSRVNVVLAVLCKSVMASLKSTRGTFRPTLIAQAVNLRTRVDPMLSRNAIGNLAWAMSFAVEEEKETELDDLFKKIMAFKECLTEKSRRVKGEEFEEAQREMEGMFVTKKDLLVCSSWCNFQLFEVDFGMGKPVWMTSVSQFLAARFIQLLDTKEVGGVEALVFLEEEEMTVFERDEELLQFAMLESSVV